MSDSSGALVSSIIYEPFGLTRRGSVPTDIKFTGQRLDDTGLYYYGARYYDPTIGRFISADTIVQNPNNPQSLNRYSYVFNNPLRYTDPSGLIVEFENEDIIITMLEAGLYAPPPGTPLGDMIQAWSDLRSGWEELASVAPDLVEKLNEASQTITIGWGSYTSTTQAFRDDLATGNINISISHEDKGVGDVRYLASALGHEGFHAAEHVAGMSWQYNTAANEAFAYSFGYQVSKALGYENQFGELVPFSAKLSNINPFADIGTLRRQVSESGVHLLKADPMHYSRFALWSGETSPMRNWPSLPFNMGAGKFLTVAQETWVK